MEMERAQEYIQQVFATGGGGDEDGESGGAGLVNQSRVEWALQQAYDSDPGFRETLDELLPNAAELRSTGELGAALAEQLKELAGDEQWAANVKTKWTK